MTTRQLRKPSDMPVMKVVLSPRLRAQAKLAQYLLTLPDAQVQRLYGECVAAGRTAAANMCIAEANDRLTKRAFAKRAFKPVVWQEPAREPVVLEDLRAAAAVKADWQRRNKLEINWRYRQRQKGLQHVEPSRAPGRDRHERMENTLG